MALSEHLEKLRHFQRLTQFNSINEASKAIGISQAGLSKCISNLEAELEVSLFKRSSDGLVLTKEGAITLEATQKILNLAGELEGRLRSLRSPKSPEVFRLGMYDSIAVYFFPALDAYVRKIYNTVELTLTVANSRQLEEKIRSDEIDIAIGANLKQNKRPDTEFVLLFEDYYSFYVSPRASIQTDEMPLLIHPVAEDEDGNSLEKLIAPTIKNYGLHRVHNFETLKTMTTQGLGIGVMPTQVARSMVENRTLRQIRLPKTKSVFGKHQIGFIAKPKFIEKYKDFTDDIYRLGAHWMDR